MHNLQYYQHVLDTLCLWIIPKVLSALLLSCPVCGVRGERLLVKNLYTRWRAVSRSPDRFLVLAILEPCRLILIECFSGYFVGVVRGDSSGFALSGARPTASACLRVTRCRGWGRQESFELEFDQWNWFLRYSTRMFLTDLIIKSFEYNSRGLVWSALEIFNKVYLT